MDEITPRKGQREQTEPGFIEGGTAIYTRNKGDGAGNDHSHENPSHMTLILLFSNSRTSPTFILDPTPKEKD
jgi:hypothetical protein